MTTSRAPLALALGLAVSLSTLPLAAAPAAADDPGPGAVSIVADTVTMQPGEFDALRHEVADGIDVVDLVWSVDSGHVVDVDARTGRVDALGTGTATISLTATDADGATHTDSVPVRVAAGADPVVAPVPALQNDNRPDFMLGADVSSAHRIQQQGGTYHDLQGQEAELFDILAAQGVNWVRLRVWNDPYDPFGNPYGGGNSSVESTIALAKQAKARGMKVNVVFHYSDFWAHPGQQARPKAWSALTGQALVDAVGAFTTESLTAMRDAGVYPNMVTVGNETNDSIVDVRFRLNAAGYMDPTAVGVYKAGAAAVRATDPNAADPTTRTLVSFHLANGNNATLYNRFTLALATNAVDYDALGASYYPSWHGTLDEVRSNLDTISSTYGKYVYVAETAYPWTIDENAGDDTPQNFKAGDVSTMGMAASVQGQATALRDVIDVAASIQGEKGLGVFYWEPAWLPGPTTGWATPYGTGWESAGLFDINGYALPSLRTFALVRGDQAVPETADDWAYGWETTVAVEQGGPLTMPTTVIAVREDGRMGATPRTIDRQPVVWDAEDLAAVDTATAGEYIVHGSVAGIEDNVFASVVVRTSPTATAAAPTFSLPDGAEVDAVGNGYSYSARHVDESAGGIEIMTSTANASVSLTLDGADPVTGAGSTQQLVGAPWVKAFDSIRTYAGPVQISQNVELRASARRTGYAYDAGAWGSDVTLLAPSPVTSARYRAVYDYDRQHVVDGGFEAPGTARWQVEGDGEVVAPADWVRDAYAGDRSFAVGLDAGERLRLAQEVVVPDGTYTVSLRVRGDDQTAVDTTDAALTATSGGQSVAADVRTITVPGGSMIWREYTVRDVEVVDNRVTLAFEATASAAWSGHLDHLVLAGEGGAEPDPVTTARTLVSELMDGAVSQRGQSLSLRAKLDAATRSLEAGNTAAATAQLAAFDRQVRVLTGRSLTVEESDVLLRWSAAARG